MTKKNTAGNQILSSVLNSYSQVFFSTSKTLAVFLVVISFFDYGAGVGGLVAVLVANTLAWGLGYNKYYLRSGLYGFNALLVGLGVGLYYQPSPEVYVLVAVTAILCFFLTIVFQGVLGKYGLPFLSVPFLITIWIVALSANSLQALNLSERGIFIYNELYSLGDKQFVDFYNFLETSIRSSFIRIYFHSLGAIFFQSHLLAGIIIAVGLLIYSRITFTLSVLGYGVAFLFYQLVGIEFDSLGYTFIGFNYILTAIALGGYYLVPGRASFGWIILLLPAVVLITTSAQQVFLLFRISPYSLPFNAIVLTFLYALKLREKRPHYLIETPVQMGKPEKNLYLYSGNTKRFPAAYSVSAALPFFGEWTVSQAHNGEYTHKGAWRHAWDFIITDRTGEQFCNSGDFAEDYYCFGKAVLSPADGTVVEVINNIPDNTIGDVNTKDNWGNTIIIKHSEYLYSKLSHLKFQSIDVKTGDALKRGQLLGKCGNSGRSPYPHLHFQFQASPHVGSATLDYPLGHYLQKEDNGYLQKSFEFPQKNQVLVNPSKNEVLDKALHFIPGRRINIKVEVDSKNAKWKKLAGEFTWIVETDVYNTTSIRCEQDNAVAYLYNQGDMHFFTNFAGRKHSPLFWFYISLFKVPVGFQANSQIKDSLPVHLLFSGILKYLQDFVAPLFLFLKADYELILKESGDIISQDSVKMEAEITKRIAGKMIKKSTNEIAINSAGDFDISIKTEDAKLKILCRNELD
ncbi:Urea transporter [Mariniphaga anaerophila]|uniref:Urea transporter n=1 Tax=Mariniphaga anaerophila TaxID=1484053 RepID=A0A1M5BTD1_9BACT|nr:urea transporter [Mariniphaga anaerophila]SHF45581.1 Urea transporter [Mariniphaga anaerophila]